jgi:flagellar biosynthesis GTPase FlhF
MIIRKFIAPTARQAKKEISTELGFDVMILSNQKTEYGVEILTLALGDPQHAVLMRKMLNVGFSTLLARQLLNKMPTKKARELWAKAIDRILQEMRKADDIVVKGAIRADRANRCG